MRESFKKELEMRLVQFVEPRKALLKHKIISQLNYDGRDLAFITHNMMRVLLYSSLCGRRPATIESFGRFIVRGRTIVFEASAHKMRRLYDDIQNTSPSWTNFLNNCRSLNDERLVRVLGGELENVKNRSGVSLAKIAYHTWVSIIVWCLLERKCVNICVIGKFISIGGVIQYTASPVLQGDLDLSLRPKLPTRLLVDREP
jgi:hypothetical protein